MSIVIHDGNAYSIMGAGRKELIRLGRGDEVQTMLNEMMAGDYDHLLRTLVKWFPDTEIEY